MEPRGGAASLDIDCHPAFQERWWQVERVGWALMALLLVAALAGLTGGGGALSRAQARSGEASIDYPRIARWQAAEGAVITFPATASGAHEVLLSNAFLDIFTVEAMIPQPSQVVSTAGGQRFTFELAEGTGSKTAHLFLRASRPSLPTRVSASVGQAPPGTLHFIVLP